MTQSINSKLSIIWLIVLLLLHSFAAPAVFLSVWKGRGNTPTWNVQHNALWKQTASHKLPHWGPGGEHGNKMWFAVFIPSSFRVKFKPCVACHPLAYKFSMKVKLTCRVLLSPAASHGIFGSQLQWLDCAIFSKFKTPAFKSQLEEVSGHDDALWIFKRLL